jgi:hypothetical protein
LNPRILGPVASTLTFTPPRRCLLPASSERRSPRLLLVWMYGRNH